MQARHPLIDTFEQILREQTPNFLRLYLNPFVTQTCYCLDLYVQSVWAGGPYQTFLANGFDEALSGAIKLGRYAANLAGQPTNAVVFDPRDRLGPFASTSAPGGGNVEFLPGVEVRSSREEVEQASGQLEQDTGPRGAAGVNCRCGVGTAR